MTPDDPLVGRLIGPYVIQSLLGAGGMGRVYRARDSKLERDVAIKVLPDAVAADPERVARFAREARVLASLNHPNIAAIYGFEHASSLQGLVLELVEGETLADRLRAGPIPLEQALTIARQIADALNAAHEKGIIHRDLKPANVIIQSGRDTKVKVLDFGLAKVAPEDAADLTRAPTATFGGTRDGAVMGTTAYMSPEQARGQELDQRTDIWSFGCVVYEMTSGRPAFPGATVSDTIAAILGSEPDWNALPRSAPPAVRAVIKRCLEKDVTKRPRDIAEIRDALDRAIVAGPPDAGYVPNEASGFSRGAARLPRWSLAPIAAVLVLVGIGAIVWAVRPHMPTPTATVSAPLEQPVQLTNFNDSALAPALSPDGRYLAFIRGGGFGTSLFLGQVWVKMLPEGAPVQLTHDQFGKESPTFSPDGSRIVYTSVINGFKWDSWHVPVLGGAPALFLTNASGLIWADDKQLVYSEIAEGINMGLATSDANRLGQRRIYLPQGAGAMAHRSAISPDRKSLLVVEMDGVGWLPCRLLPFDGSSVGRRVGPQEGQCTTAAWSPDGKWMYFSSDAGGMFHVWRQQYPNGVPQRITAGTIEEEGTAVTPDGKHVITSMGLQQAAIWLHDSKGNRQLTSEGFTILPTMASEGGRAYYLMHNRGTRSYISGELWSIDLTTGEQSAALPGQTMAEYAISRDGKKVLFTSAEGTAGGGVWIANLDRRTPPQQLTRNGEDRAMFGAPGEIIYMSQHDNIQHLFRMRDDGSDNVQVSPEPVIHLINVSPDGRWAAVTAPIGPNSDGSKVMLVSTRGEPSYVVCYEGCSLGFGPARIEAPMLAWDANGTSFFVALKKYGLHTQQTVVLPYRSGAPLDTLWPKGLKTQEDVLANPGARVISEGDAFPGADSSAYLFWKRTVVSNLYRLPMPQ